MMGTTKNAERNTRLRWGKPRKRGREWRILTFFLVSVALTVSVMIFAFVVRSC